MGVLVLIDGGMDRVKKRSKKVKAKRKKGGSLATTGGMAYGEKRR